MPNLQQLLPPSLLEELACAVQCCDKKEYPLQPRAGDKECQRLGSKKHSCVLHKFREKKGGRLTTKNKHSDLKASPRFPSEGRTLIPDFLYKDEVVIDLKFPCPDNITSVPAGKTKQQISKMSVGGAEMLGDKEKIDYKSIDGVEKVEGMSPKDAQEIKSDCKCEDD